MEEQETPLDKLTPKEKRFVSAYCSNGFVGKAAAKAANPSYSEGGADTMARKILKRPHVRAAIRYIVDEELAEVREVLHKRIVDVYLRRAFFRPAELLDDAGRLKKSIEELGDDQFAIDGIKRTASKDGVVTTIELADRDRALEQLAKYISLIKGDDADKEDSGVRVVVLAHDQMTPEQWNERFGQKKSGE